ncbi:class I SAM-dependent methyltransferase [Streptomyces sp. TRM66268-LWL]|uniref:Class I SAM-dependent methyltransferase n=1 Tax=Streptomyces polyasparticus TaxID=2767826 RepID=A0ABR7SC52_9ACTN|nr:class I SAM-dependent methyltransferase [Streptomyces polyasparticus]MBC9712315.1 class I SAM-dependent methyltransferase [Streptomyces polyasparticus]
MPTIPAGEPHRQRRMAESFGTDAARYDRARPHYPDALIDRIVDLGPGPDLLDVGCGTGIAARQLRAAGCTVLGVEPDARMAAYAHERYGLDVEVARFEDWQSADRTFDAVVSGQAWHWIDPVAGAAKAARVLRPGGRLSLFWNVFRLPAPVADALVAACREVLPDAPFDLSALGGQQADAYTPILGKVSQGLVEAGGFGTPVEWTCSWSRDRTRDEYLDEFPTSGAAARLAPQGLALVLDRVGAAIDALGGSFTMAYTTVELSAVRRP